MDCSVLNNGMETQLMQPTAMLQAVGCHTTLSPMKNPFHNEAFLQNSFTICLLSTHADKQGVDISVCVFVCLFVCLYGYGFLRRG